MSELMQTLPGLFAIVAIMLVAWPICIGLRNMGLVDLFWGPVIAVAGYVYWALVEQPPLRATILLALAFVWALRLTVHLYTRGLGKPEDRRYADMRRRNEPAFWLKSLYLVFVLQGLIAWIISFALYGGIINQAPLGWLDYAGMALFVFGLLWETVADWQLTGFLSNDSGREGVMDRGLWRYSRHPNYFGECCLWWGIWLMSASSGVWWTIVSPLLMSVLLLRVSGVSLLEKDIGERRPAYAEYKKTTSAFFPLPPAK